MIKFKLEKISEGSSHYNLYFGKNVNKRDGTTVIEFVDKIYTISLKDAESLIANRETQNNFEDKNISLKEYLKQFYKNLKLCKSLNQISY
jgi:topoisomerase IA-like protein